jgi:hypothetical protein
MRISRQVGRGKGQRYSNSFRLGFVYGIKTQLHKAHDEAAQTAPKTAAIVLRNRYQRAQDALHDLIPLKKGKPLRTASRINHDGLAHGMRRGREHHLGKSIEG